MVAPSTRHRVEDLAGRTARTGGTKARLRSCSYLMVDRVMYGEDRWVTACERETTRPVVLVHVNDLGLPSAMSSSYLEGS
jgi:hypothetical protein